MLTISVILMAHSIKILKVMHNDLEIVMASPNSNETGELISSFQKDGYLRHTKK